MIATLRNLLAAVGSLQLARDIETFSHTFDPAFATQISELWSAIDNITQLFNG